VIFGAGASYDSIPTLAHPDFASRPLRPPLADELFANKFAGIFRNRKYRRHLPPIVTRMLTGEVERKLEELRLEAKSNPEVPKQLAAVQYYLQDLIKTCQVGWNGDIENFGGLTNYGSFIDEVEGWRQRVGVKEVFCVTFNYDTLLEDSLGRDPRIDLRINRMSDYVMGIYKVIKPHGSINWSHHISMVPGLHPNLAMRNEDDYIPTIIDNAGELRIDDAIELKHVSRDPQYPALAIPVETKSDYECPKEHIDKLWEFLPSVKIVISVGWRAREEHFMQRLVQGLSSEVKWQIVSSNQQSAEEVKKHMEQTGIKGDIFATSASGFTAYETSVEAKRFLDQMSVQ